MNSNNLHNNTIFLIYTIINNILTFEESDNFQAIAFSRPPPPTTSTLAIKKTNSVKIKIIL